LGTRRHFAAFEIPSRVRSCKLPFERAQDRRVPAAGAQARSTARVRFAFSVPGGMSCRDPAPAPWNMSTDPSGCVPAARPGPVRRNGGEHDALLPHGWRCRLTDHRPHVLFLRKRVPVPGRDDCRKVADQGTTAPAPAAGAPMAQGSSTWRQAGLGWTRPPSSSAAEAFYADQSGQPKSFQLDRPKEN
jgi:hypothetical protein